MTIVGAIAVPHPPLIVPSVGRGEEKRIQATIDAYRQAAAKLLASKPDCLVVTSPHAPMFRDGFHVTTEALLIGDMARFRAPGECIEAHCDTALAKDIIRRANAAGITAVGSERYYDDMDHGTFVPLWFIREAYYDSDPDATGDLPCPIVRIGLSGLSPKTHRALGHVVAEAAASLGRRVGFVASGDLSHKLKADGPYGFAPEGPVFDERIGQIFASGNLDGLFAFDAAFCEAAAECGLRSFQIMAGALDGLTYETAMLSNEGPFGVGYGVATCFPTETDAAVAADGNRAGSHEADAALSGEPAESEETGQPDPHIALARLTVETYVRTGHAPAIPDDCSAELLDRRAGVFVSLHEHGRLRGCIGTIGPVTDSIAQEIIQNGISACSRDPRFDPVQPDELDYLDYSVDVLDEAEPIESTDELDPVRYGVIVTKGWRRGLLLPNLDGVDTVADQVAIAKQKAGISISDNDVQLERFEVVRYTRGGEPRKP